MCGGLAFNIKKIARGDLEKYFSPGEIGKFEKTGSAQSFFWSEKPVLPVENEEKVELIEWGNRDKEVALPKTGWAKEESVDEGKWAHFNPKIVKIPVEKGYEKGVWFEVESGTFKGIVIEKDDLKRAYMLTKQADPAYLKLTKHDRQPVPIEK